MSNDLTLAVKITGDAKQLGTELTMVESDLQDLGKVGKSISILEGAVERVKEFETEVTVAQAKVKTLQATLSEAYNSGSDAPQIKNLQKQLAEAESAAIKAEQAFIKSTSAVVKLNLEGAKAGITTGNLARKKAELAGEAQKVGAKIEGLNKQLHEAVAAENLLLAKTNSLNGAFSTLNIRSANQINADILQINQALVKLSANTNLSGAEFDRAFATGQAQIGKLKSELAGVSLEPAAKGFNLLEAAANGLKGAMAGLAVGAVGEKFLSANLAADKLQKSLQAVNGDATKTASDLAFLKETAQRLGINLESSSAGFVKLAASAKGTRLEGQATRDIFSSVAGSLAQLGLSSADTERAFAAIAQMMSKGTIQAEELKGQLGDVLPGAMGIAARATGLTTQELGKLMESGGLLAEDFLPKFSKEITKTFGGGVGEVQGLSNSIERLKNTWNQAFKAFGDNGSLAMLGGILGVISEGLLILATGLNVVVGGFTALVKSVAAATAALLTWDASHLLQSLKDIWKGFLGTSTEMANLTGVAKISKEALNGTGDAASAAGNKAQASSIGWEKLIVAYDQSIKSMADLVEMSKRTEKANNDQAAVLVELAALAGNELDLLRRKEDAARTAAIGSEKVAEALDMEAKALQAKLIALQEETKGEQNLAPEKAKAIEDAKKLAEAKTEEARAADALNDKHWVAVAALEAESAARADNSARVLELKDAYEKAALQVDVLRAAQMAGMEVGDALKDAQIAAAKASRLYNDALGDQVEKIKTLNDQKQAQFSLDTTVLNLAIAKQKSIQQTARLMGDEYAATQAGIQIKKLEIELMGIQAKMKAAEAEAILETVKAKRAELSAAGELTAAKEAELRAQELGAEAKKKESEIITETVKQMKEMKDATDLYGESAVNAAMGTNKLSNGLDSIASSADNAANSLKKVKDAEGEVGKDGIGSRQERVGGISGTQFYTQKMMAAGFSPEATQKAIDAAMFVSSQLLAKSNESGSSGDLGHRIDLKDAENRGIEAGLAAGAAAELEAQKANTSGAQTVAVKDYTQTNPAPTAPAPSGGTTSTVNINLNGRATPINVASPTDAANLTTFFKQLESDATRAV